MVFRLNWLERRESFYQDRPDYLDPWNRVSPITNTKHCFIIHNVKLLPYLWLFLFFIPCTEIHWGLWTNFFCVLNNEYVSCRLWCICLCHTVEMLSSYSKDFQWDQIGPVTRMAFSLSCLQYHNMQEWSATVKLLK